MASRPADAPIEAVIFDWGGTLTPWHIVDVPEQWRVFAREVHGIPVDSPEVPQEDLDAAAELAARILAAEERAWKRGRDDHSSAAIAAILEEAGVDPAHDRHHLALAAYRGFWEPHTFTDPQVRPVWEGLRDRGIRVGVLSNTIWSRDYHRGLFERDGVLDLVDGDVYSSEIDHVKPHPEAFHAACRAVDVKPEAAVYVGDRLFEDVWGAGNAGMRSILVPHSDIPASQRGHSEGEPDAVVERLGHVYDVVSAWNA